MGEPTGEQALGPSAGPRPREERETLSSDPTSMPPSARAEMGALVAESQAATGALQATQAGNQLLALQSGQIADLTAAIAAQNRAQALESARRVSAEAQGRENLARFLDYGSGYEPTTVRMFGG